MKEGLLAMQIVARDEEGDPHHTFAMAKAKQKRTLAHGEKEWIWAKEGYSPLSQEGLKFFLEGGVYFHSLALGQK